MFEIKNIMIVDCKAENIQAATEAIYNLFPSAEVQTFTSPDEAIIALRDKSPKPDIVFSGIDMESKAGYYISSEALAWNIPVVEILEEAGGVSLSSFNIFFEGNKNNPETWRSILWIVFSGDEKDNPILFALNHGKKQAADYVFGKGCTELIIRNRINNT